MGQSKRILIGLGILVLIVAVVMGSDALRRRAVVPAAHVTGASLPVDGTPLPGREPPTLPAQQKTALAITTVPGSVPVYLDGVLVASFSPNDIQQLKKVSFVEPVEGKTEEGWLLRDVLLLYLKPEQLKPDTQVTVFSSSRKKSAQLTWAEISDDQNMVMFDLANRGTLKMVSRLERLSTREQWVQDVDKIEAGHQGVNQP
jgi:hypothetical protein